MSIITSGIKKLVEDNAMALATVDKSGRPHNIAVACCKVFGNKVIVTNAHIKETLKNIKDGSQVSLAVWHKEWEKASVGFELKGKAENITTGKWFEYLKDLPENKECQVKSAIVITVSKIKKLLS